MTNTETFFAEAITQSIPDLKTELADMIRAFDTAQPRSQQRELGPSEIGHPCMRRLAYLLLETQRCNPSWDPLPAIIGTATHKWLETAAHHANEQLGRQRWLTETRVHPADWLSGSCDLYDTDTATVIDYKVPGANQFTKYKKDPGPVYRTQVHLYGKGFIRAGHPVKTVAIMYLPRGGTLTSAHLWAEPYNQAIADEAIDRRNQIVGMLDDFDIEHHPDRFAWFARTGPSCIFCPFWSATPTGPLQCAGDD